MRLSSYGLQLDQLIQGIGASNSLVAAGAIEGSEGKYAVKVPALIETPEDVANLPVVAGPNAVVRVRDLATVRSTFKDAETITRIDGKTRHHHRGQEAHRRQRRRDDRGRQGGRRAVRRAEQEDAARPEGHLHPGQVGLRQPAADRPAEPRDDRRHPGLHRHPLRAVRPRLAADRPRHPVVVPDGHPAAGADGLHDQHDRAVLPDPGGRHAGRRRHHRHRIRRAAHVGRHAQGAGLRASRQAHGRPGHRGDPDAHRRLLAAAVLAGHRRRLHEIPADHADRDAGGVDGLCADLRADDRRDLRQGAAA